MASCPNCKTDVNSLVAERLNQYEFTVDEEGINYDDIHNLPNPMHAYKCPECGHCIAEQEKEAAAFLNK